MTIATVIAITGQAWARDADGNLRELRVGDSLQEGETLVTADNASVQLDFGDGLGPTLIDGGQQVAMTPELDADQPVAASEFSALDEDLEALLAAIDEGEGDLLDVLDATAAGAGPGGGADGGHTFVMLGRIAEDVNPLAFNFEGGQLAAIDFPEDVAPIEVAEEAPIDGIPEAGSSSAELFDAQLLQEGGSVFTSTLAFDFGPDGAGSIGFAGMDGTTGQVGTETVTYSWNAATNTLTATGPRGELFSLVVNPATGEYTLTLLDNVLHAEDTDEAGIELTFTVIDGNGTPANGNLAVTFFDDVPSAEDVGAELGAGVYDAITGNVMTDGTPDTQGADTARVTQVVVGDNAPVLVPESGSVEVAGAYGVLTIAADGSYSYVRNEGTPGGVEETFTYTLTDADGDSDTATLTIAIADADISIIGLTAEGADLTLDEANLANGSAPDADALVQSGSFTISAADGIAQLSVGGEAIVEDGAVVGTLPTLTTEAGNVLAITAFTDNGDGTYTVDYRYTLNSNKFHAQPEDDTALFQDFAVSVTDNDGDTASGTLTVEILDDVPSAEDVGAELGAGVYDAITGNVMTDGTPDTQGADSARVTQVVVGDAAPVAVPESGSVEVAGAYGVLTIAADGSYSYVRNEGTPGGVEETFTYTLTDADGDSDTATLTIAIADADISIIGLTAEGADLTLDEANLANGSAPDADALVQSGSFTISAADGIAQLSVGGEAIVEDGVVVGTLPTLTTEAGNVLAITAFTDNGDGTYTVDYRYTLNSNKFHAQPEDDTALFQDFAVSVTDNDGDTAGGTLTVEILDDVPSAEDVGAELGAGVYDAIAGNVMTDGTPDTQGADTARVTQVVVGDAAPVAVPESGSVEVAGAYGVLTIAADGSYSYVRNEGTPGGVEETFTYTLTDADGDSDTATLTIAIADADISLSGLTTEGADLTLDEANLANGSAPDADALVQSGSFTISAADGIAQLSVGDEAIVQDGVVVGTLPTLTTEAGNVLAITAFTDNGDGTYTVDYRYTLNSNKFHAQPEDDTALFQDFAVSVTDNDGDTAGGTLTVEILDDVPSAEDVGAELGAGVYDAIAGNVMTDGTPDTQGADSARVTQVVVGDAAPVAVPESGSVEVAGAYGVLTITADGSYSYVRNEGTPGGVEETFTYTLTDADGDSDTATLTIAIADADISIIGLTAEGADLTLDEANLANGSAPDADALVQSGSFTISAADGIAQLSVGGEAIVEDGAVVGTLPTLTTEAGNVLAITAFTDNGDGTYTVDYRYTLNSNKFHAQPEDDTALFQDFAVSVTDNDGDTAGGTLTVEILDDVPSAEDVGAELGAGVYDAIAGNVMTDGTPDTQGADSARVTQVVVGDAAPVAVPESGSVEVAGAYGVLTITADGSYSYVRNEGTPGGVEETFTYTLTDADGDSDTATLTIAIADADISIIGLTAEGADLTLDEANLANGSAPDADALVQSGSFTISAADGIAQLSVGGEAIVEDGAVVGTLPTLTTEAGNVLAITAFTDNGDGTYTVDYRYTLNSNKFHAQPEDDTALFQDFAVSVTDNDGDTAGGTLTVEILDDVPSAEDVGAELGAGVYDAITGNVMTDGTPDTQGADTARVTQVVVGDAAPVAVPESGSVEVAGAYGVLTITADGSYSYVRNEGTPGGVEETFTYTLTDADGDSDTATLTIAIADADISIIGLTAEGADLTLDEANLANGSAPDADALVQSGSFTISAADGIAQLSVGGEAIVEDGAVVGTLPTLTTEAGNVLAITAFTDNGDGTYTVDYRYTLNSNKFHAQPEDDTALFQDFAVSVTDNDGDTAGGTLTVEILDDVPSAEDVGAELGAGVYDAIAGNVMTDGTPDTQGADSARVTQVVVGDAAPVAVPESGSVEVAGAYGVLTIAADGSYSYVRNEGTPGGVEETFTYTLTDADGDSDTATLTIAIADADISLSGLTTEGADLTLDEANLANGSAPDADALVQSGSFTISAADGIAQLSVGGEAIVEDGAVVGTLPTLTTEAGNVLAITAFTDNGDGTYTVDYRYTLNSNKFHAQPEDDTALFQDFAVSVTDNDGDTASGTLTVEILDDVPVEDIRSVIFQNSAGFSFVGTAAQMGADQDGAQLNWTQAPTGLFYQGTLLQYEGVGTNTLIAFVGEGDDRVNVFKLTGNSDGSYVYEQFQPIDLVTTEIRDFTAGDFDEAGGPEPNIYILEDGSVTRTQPGESTPWAIEISGVGGSGGNADQINSNANGFGVGNPSVDKGESVTFNFDIAGESGSKDLFSSASIEFSASSGIKMNYVVTYSDGSTATGVFYQADLVNQMFTFEAPSGLFLDSIVIVNDGSSTLITGFGVSQIVELIDEGLPFDLGFEAIDGDGDVQGGVIDFFAEPGETLDASGEQDGLILVGSEGDNILLGGDGDDILYGGAGDDTLSGGAGDDTLIGGAGDDILTGGGGNNVFVWHLGDQGTDGSVATDTVTDFTLEGGGADKLVLSDLLQGMESNDDLSSYLHATEDGDNTLLHISSTGGLAVDGDEVSGADQVIILEGVDYSENLIQQMLENGQLEIE